MLGKLSEVQIEQLLHSQLVGRIGCHADQLTYVVPISYAYDGNYVYAHTHEGKKLEMMRKNPNVCFEVDILKDLSEWQSVIAYGEFEELINAVERNQAIRLLTERSLPLLSSVTMHLSPHWPFTSEGDNDIPGGVFRIKLGEKTGRFENNSASPAFAG
jgi:nitroimidazol reductase NimA-like FMN-containing flavoprotein (pyridoxamine 5'-phosphate oxidase superfamily)